ncbi:MAG: type II CAAX endopeptidase family protein [Terriglobales bacterium]
MNPEIFPELDALPSPPPPPKRDPAWGYIEIVAVVGIFFVALVLCAVTGFAIARALLPGIPPGRVATNPLFFVPIQFGAYILTYVVSRLMLTAKAGEPFWQAIRWHMPPARIAAAGAGLGVMLAFLVQLLSAVLPFPKSLPMHEYFREIGFAYMMAAFAILVAPLAEEVFFRGLVFPVLVRSMGQVAAIVVTGATFSLMHRTQLAWAWAPLLVLFGVGAMLTLIRARTNSVAASWIVHVAYNTTLFASIYYFSNGFRNLAR